MSSNSIMMIHPYKRNSQWMFDDEDTDLKGEALVAGIDTMLDILTSDIPKAVDGFNLLFAGIPFPGFEIKIDRVPGSGLPSDGSGGTWYRSEDYDMPGWLCPALFKYFEKAPEHIYVKAEASS